jgi:MFS family permease
VTANWSRKDREVWIWSLHQCGATIRAVSAIASTPGALRLLSVSIVARLPEAMIGIALLVHAQHLTGSFALAGLATGAYAVAEGVGAPLLGRIVDRRGQTAPLLASAAAAAVLLCAVALLPAGAPVAVLVALSAGIGLASPPVAACVRALLPGLLPDAGAARAAYAVESTASELTWIAGPPLALAVGAMWSTGAALMVAAVVLAAGTAAFAAQPASRAWRPQAAESRPRGGSLRSPAMRTLIVVLLAAGALFGATEVGVAAATAALGSSSAAGPLLGIWGVGSLLGGVVAARVGGGAERPAGLALILGLLAAGHLALTGAAGSVAALAVVLLVAGAAIAPTFSTVYAMVERAAPAATLTEAFAWLATAVAVGSAAGSALGGALADRAGAPAAFALAGGAGAVALLAAALRSRELTGQPPNARAAAATISS